jgi:hypothetical protein
VRVLGDVGLPKNPQLRRTQPLVSDVLLLLAQQLPLAFSIPVSQVMDLVAVVLVLEVDCAKMLSETPLRCLAGYNQ